MTLVAIAGLWLMVALLVLALCLAAAGHRGPSGVR